MRASAIVLSAALLQVVTTCAKPPSSAFERYMASQHDNNVEVEKIIAEGHLPDVAAELEKAKVIVAGMRADRIERIRALGVPLLFAAELEQRTALDLTTEGERLSIVWERQWYDDPGDRDANDPLDAGPHIFDLRRLAGAKNWTATNWSGRRDETPTSTYADHAGCIAELVRYDA